MPDAADCEIHSHVKKLPETGDAAADNPMSRSAVSSGHASDRNSRPSRCCSMQHHTFTMSHAHAASVQRRHLGDRVKAVDLCPRTSGLPLAAGAIAMTSRESQARALLSCVRASSVQEAAHIPLRSVRRSAFLDSRMAAGMNAPCRHRSTR